MSSFPLTMNTIKGYFKYQLLGIENISFDSMEMVPRSSIKYQRLLTCNCEKAISN